MLAVIFVSALSLANALGHGRVEHDSVWDRYDVNKDSFITIDDLRILNDFTHIWHATEQTDDVLTQDDLEDHKSGFSTLWDDIMKTFQNLDVNHNGEISKDDFLKVTTELKYAEDALLAYEANITEANKALGTDAEDHFSVTLDQLNNVRKQSQDKFNYGVQLAFSHLGGDEHHDVSFEDLAKYTDDIALLWSVMEQVMQQAEENYDDPNHVYAVPKQAYENKLDEMERLSQDKAGEEVHLVDDAQKDCLENGNCDSSDWDDYESFVNKHHQ